MIIWAWLRLLKICFNFYIRSIFPTLYLGRFISLKKKTFAFDDKLNILGFEGTIEELRPLTKHQDKVKN